ncbi:MAG: hypothetical protein K6G08_00375 [Prevotella sp.]|nr:hypothetical protein [Prevotella sp.]
MENKLKKLLAAVEKELLRKPNRKTLDHLSLLAGFQDWDEFQDALEGSPKHHKNNDATGAEPHQ